MKKPLIREYSATRYIPPTPHKSTPNAPGIKGAPDDWSKPTQKTPLEDKGYKLGVSGSSNVGNHGITSRKEYHQASKGFHKGRADHLLKKPGRLPAENEQLKYHKEWYGNHLKATQDLYGKMEHHAKVNNLPTGAGHTRYVTKS